MNNRSWRGTILFSVILVVMGGTVGLKLYGVGEGATSAPTSIHSATAASGSTTGSAASTSTSSDTATTTPTQPASPTTTAVTGTAVQTRYGIVQVKVTFSGSTITAVNVLQSPNREGRDVEINQRALPVLQQEVLASQSAKIDTVSGATYTSDGYKQSVQSALDQR